MKGLVVDNGSGEIVGHGGAMIYGWEEVDKERFAKLYLANLKQAAGLTKPSFVSKVKAAAAQGPGTPLTELAVQF